MAGARTMVCNDRRPGQASQAPCGLTRPKAGAASPEAATAEDRATGWCVAGPSSIRCTEVHFTGVCGQPPEYQRDDGEQMHRR